MSRRDVLITKLSATMDPDNARALLDEVIHEQRNNPQGPDFGLLTRRLIQRVVAAWPYYASNDLNDGFEAELRQAWSAQTDRLVDDLSDAIRFMRELAGTPCEWACSSHPEEPPCIRCRVETWLHTESK